MLNARLNAARRIADALGPAEAEIESAISSTSMLISAIAEGRRDSGVPLSIGQKGLSALTGSMAALVQARESILAAHAALAEDKIAAGLRVFGMGDLGDCPSTSGALKLVEEDRSAA